MSQNIRTILYATDLGLSELLIGSVAQEATVKTKAPVLLVPIGA